jgi:hypothetical protein
MIVHLAERLRIPLRERNALLVAAGYAPAYAERRLDEPGFEAARGVVELILKGHEPYPALAVDRHWNLLVANDAVHRLLIGIDPALLESPVNVLRLSLHPDGLAPRIANFRDWRGHILARLVEQADQWADHGLARLIEELKRFPVPADASPPGPSRDSELLGLAVPLELRTERGILSLLSTTTVFGTPSDISLSELAIESFFPANAETAAELARSASA